MEGFGKEALGMNGIIGHVHTKLTKIIEAAIHEDRRCRGKYHNRNRQPSKVFLSIKVVSYYYQLK